MEFFRALTALLRIFSYSHIVTPTKLPTVNAPVNVNAFIIASDLILVGALKLSVELKLRVAGGFLLLLKFLANLTSRLCLDNKLKLELLALK